MNSDRDRKQKAGGSEKQKEQGKGFLERQALTEKERSVEKKRKYQGMLLITIRLKSE